MPLINRLCRGPLGQWLNYFFPTRLWQDQPRLADCWAAGLLRSGGWRTWITRLWTQRRRPSPCRRATVTLGAPRGCRGKFGLVGWGSRGYAGSIVSRTALSNRTFLDRVRDYLPTDALMHETDADGRLAARLSHGQLKPHTFYLFDADTHEAFWHAIVELALEEANGSLLACFGQFQEARPYQDWLRQAACTLDRVDLIGSGRPLRGIPQARFIVDARGGCRQFRLVLYEGRRAYAMAIGRMVNPPLSPQPGWQVGFYTLNARVVRHFRAELLDVARGRAAVAQEFLRLQAIDQASKALQRELLQQQAALNEAWDRLRLDRQRYGPAPVLGQLERGLARLQAWRTRLPRLMGQVGAAGGPDA